MCRGRDVDEPVDGEKASFVAGSTGAESGISCRAVWIRGRRSSDPRLVGGSRVGVRGPEWSGVEGHGQIIAVDSNILIYAHRKDSPWHDHAAAKLIASEESPKPWAIPWPCVHEFFTIATHPRFYRPPTPALIALADCGKWFASPSLMVHSSGIVGPMVHDARIAEICRAHGVTRLWSADRDFWRFGIAVHYPMVG